MQASEALLRRLHRLEFVAAHGHRFPKVPHRLRLGEFEQLMDRAAGGSGDGSSDKDPALERQLEHLRESIEAGVVGFADVVTLTYWASLEDKHDPRRLVGVEFKDRARKLFKDANGGEETRIGVFGNAAMGVYLKPDGTFRWIISRAALRFDISEAHRLIYEIDAMAERAREWWLVRSDGRGPTEREEEGKRWARAATSRRRSRELQLRPHLDRAYMLMTGAQAAVDDENTRAREAIARGEDVADQGSAIYSGSLAVLRPEVERARQLLEEGGQRLAQVKYGLGMLAGVAIIGLICAIVGLVFWAGDVDAQYGVAAPAGALGALVSVLQRMTSGSLSLDVNTGGKMLTAYGAVRPLIGAILGVVVFALLEGGLLPAIDIGDSSKLAFYAGIGFLAGFNERFAQDMLARASVGSRSGGSLL